MKINESGRSMIEMLGVLAIIGVLSVGGIAGYSKAMAKFKVNKTIDQVSHIVANTRILFSSQKNYKDLGTCTAAGGTADGKKLIIAAKLMPDGMSDDSDTYFSNAYAGQMHMCAGGRLSDSDNKAFVLAFTSIPVDACIDLATQDWNAASGSGLVVIQVQGNEAETGISKIASFAKITASTCGIDSTTTGTDGKTSGSNLTNGDGVAYVCGVGANTEPMSISDATKACNGVFNTIYFKFY